MKVLYYLMPLGIVIVVATQFKPRTMDDTSAYIPSEAEKAKAIALADERARVVEYREATFEKYDDNWFHAVQTIEFGGEPLTLSIQTDGTEPTESHFQLLDWIWERRDKINSSIETEAYRYYNSVRDSEYQKMSKFWDSSTAGIILPVINSESEIWRVCGYSTIELPIQMNATLSFKIRLLCNWDDENGLEVRFRGDEIVEFGVGTW